MSCTISKIKVGDQEGVIIACSRGGERIQKCFYCSRPSSKLCDFVTGHDRFEVKGQPSIAVIAMTCDKHLCGQCARSVGPDRDHCRIHEQRGDLEAKP